MGENEWKSKWEWMNEWINEKMSASVWLIGWEWVSKKARVMDKCMRAWLSDCVAECVFVFVSYVYFSSLLLGQRFALLEEKVVLANIIRHFSLESAQTFEELKPCGELIMRPKEGIFIKLKTRFWSWIILRSISEIVLVRVILSVNVLIYSQFKWKLTVLKIT